MPDHEFTSNPNSPPASTPQPDLPQRQFLEKLVGTAAGVAILAVLFPAAAAAQLPHNVPDFCATPTLTSVQAGDWSSPSTWTPARAPLASDVVRVAHDVSVSGTAPVADCVGVTGKLTLSNNARLTAGTILVYEPGALEAGTEFVPISAEIVFADKPLAPTDLEQFGTGLIVFGKLRLGGYQRTAFQRLAVDPAAGASSLTFTQTPDGWEAGDRLAIPDTRALQFHERPGPHPLNVYTPQYEERVTATAATAETVPLDAALTYAHAGTAGYSAHVANLTRSVTLRSANPNGTRAHAIFLHRADVDIRYAAFVDMGRTTELPLDSNNQIGRYPVHFHHLSGPVTPPTSGHQFVLKGSVIERSRKWPVAVHNSHYGLVEDNVAYDWKGAGFVTEDGSETEVIFRRNFALRGTGIGGRQGEGREGVGFWFRGTDVVVTDNVAANILSTDGGVDSAYGFKFYPYQLGNVTYPIAPGSSTTTTRDGNATPVRQFERNEVYGAIESGLTFWWVGTYSEEPRLTTGESVFKDTTVWNAYNKGIFVYPCYRVTIDGFVQRSAVTDGAGIDFSDYYARDFKLRRLDIRNRIAGVGGTPHTDETVILLEDSHLENHANIRIGTNATVASSAEHLKPRRWAINRVTMVVAQAGVPYTSGKVVLFYQDQPTVNLIALDEILMDNERIYYTQQAANYEVPVDLYHPDGYRNRIGAPVAGLTNQQAWNTYGIAIAGAIATCTTTRADFVNAFVCPASGPPTSTNPTVTGGASPNTVVAGGATLLTATVVPGTNPTSTGLGVTVTTSSIGIAGDTQLFDNGTNGDATAGDNVFSRSVTVAPGTSAGAKSLPVTVSDAQTRIGSGAISLTVQAQQQSVMARQFVPISRLQYADNNAFDAPTTFTQAFWANIAADGGERELVFKDGNYIVRVSNSNLIFIWFNGSLLYGLSIPVPVFGEWHHYAWTVVGNSPAKLYVDGVDQGLSVTFFGGAPASLGNPLFLGGRSDGAPFDGALAQFGLWDEELTGTQIAALQTQKPDAVNAAALTAYIPLDADTNEHIVGITPTPTGTINTVTGPPLPTSPTVTGGASPNTVAAGGATLLTAVVTPGTNPASTGLGVTVATSSIGIAGNTPLLDNGTGGDVTAGDNVFSRSVTVASGTSAGAKSLPVTVTDAQGRSGSGAISLTVQQQSFMARQFVPISRLQYADNNCFDAGSNFSLSLWVKFASTDNYGEIVRKEGNYILRTAGSNLVWIWWDGTGQQRGFVFPLPSLNQWHQLVITVNSNVSEKVYLDGTDLGLPEGFLGGGTKDLTLPFLLGGTSAGEAFNGEASAIGLYSSVLTGTNVTALQTQTPDTVASGTLQAYVPLNADTDEHIVGITPTQTGTINTTTRP